MTTSKVQQRVVRGTITSKHSKNRFEQNLDPVQLETCRTWFNQGLIALQAERWEEAVVEFERVTTLNSNLVTALYHKGDALAHLGRYAEALASFDQVLFLQPDHPEAWIFRASMLIYLERYTDALESCNTALAMQPDNQEAWLFRGVSLHRLGDYRQAYANYDKALGVQRKSLWRSILDRLSMLAPARVFNSSWC